MTFILGSSRKVYTNPETRAHIRAVLAGLSRDQGDDEDRIVDLLEDVATLFGSFLREAEAAEAITAGQIVRVTADDIISLSRAHQSPNWLVAGAATEDIALGTVGKYVPFGVVHRNGWGLTRMATYYLSATADGEVVSAPDATTDGNRVIPVGFALTAEDLYIRPQLPILL